MKKIILLVLASYVTMAFAQEAEKTEVLVNKKGVSILPVKGDWGLGIAASPFLEYAGNLLTDAYNPAPVFTSAHPGYFYGKYYLADNTAIRAGLRIGFTSETQKEANVMDETQYDKYKSSALNFGLSVGIEKYKSLHTRLRGYYGGDFVITKTPYYGPQYNNFQMVNGKFSFTDATDDSYNYVEKGGNTLTIGAQGVIGIEYFFAPKMSVSSEFGIVLYGSSVGDRKYIPENGDPEEVFNPGGSEFGITTNTTSLINLFFYF